MDTSTTTATFPTSGNRGFVNSPTPEEAALVTRHKGVIRDHLLALYRAPLSRLPDLISTDRERIARQVLDMYGPTILDPLRETLTGYMRSGVTLGGQVGLRDLGLSGNFVLNNAGIRANLDRYVNSMVATNGDRSITRTTANELAAFIAAATEAQEEDEDNPADLIALALAAYITARADTRAFIVTAHEGVASTRYGMVSVYVRNGLAYLMYHLNRRPGARCGCERHNGKIYPTAAIPPDAQIPRHIGCQCYYTPYFVGWTKPAVVWTGD